MKEVLTELSRGNIELIRVELVRAEYWHDDEMKLILAEKCLLLNNDADAEAKIREAREKFMKLKKLKEIWNLSIKGLIYLEKKEKELLLEEKSKTETEFSLFKKELIHFINYTLERKTSALKRPYNLSTIKNLPIVLGETGQVYSTEEEYYGTEEES